MYPVLLKIGGITIHTYGVLHALGFLSGIWIARREAGRIGENPKNIMDLSVHIFISSLIGARVFFILFDGHLQSYLESPADVFKVWEGGLTYYGGFIFGVLISIWYTRKHRLNFWRTADIIAPAIAIGIAISRFGCFASGDSYGKPTALPWGVTFSSSHSLAPTGIPLHPTQLYSVLSNFLIFLVLMALRKSKRFEGELILL
ncbi:MAG: prolipoprotein diacylglyceryl transferase, partial [Thermodesulfobacteriota bacterium]